MVQSVPEADRAVVNFGSATAPSTPGCRSRSPIIVTASSCAARGVARQYRHHGSALHAGAPGSDVQVGDILLFGTSHPCLTFDKWKTLLLVDDDYNVLDELDTLF